MISIVDALLGEHGVLYALFAQTEKLFDTKPTLEAARAAVGSLNAALLSHAKIEEELLFTALGEHLPRQGGPLAVMLHEHQQIDGGLIRAIDLANVDEMIRAVRSAIAVAEDHFAKEEGVLFHMARQFLSEEQLHGLGQKWAEARGVKLGMGCG